jgi:hypothetical protein
MSDGGESFLLESKISGPTQAILLLASPDGRKARSRTVDTRACIPRACGLAFLSFVDGGDMGIVCLE